MIFFRAHASQSDNANEFHSRDVTKKVKQKMMRKDERTLMSRINFKDKLSLFKNIR